MLKEQIAEVQAEVEAYPIVDVKSLEQFRLAFLAKAGKITALLADFKNVPNDQKKEIGQLINQLKLRAQEIFDTNKESVGTSIASDAPNDFTLPPVPDSLGARHPLSLIREEIIDIFARIGFAVAEGPEIEDDWHNFSALNFAQNHPAREMQDTFFIETDPDIALRTHTSSVQVRLMENQKPPIRAIMPGRVYRNEVISARAHCMFHQVEGLYINKGVSFADLKNTLYYFARELFGADTQIRFRASYFPFTEPSAEVDVTCLICNGKGCNICKYTGWVEIGGSGMVHPNVLRNCGIDPEEYSGFAFGCGFERIVMLKHQIKDLRLFTQNDLRFLRQFQAVI